MITIACVRVGSKYGIEYVERLRNMIDRHLDSEWRMICLTDQPERVPGVEMIPVDGFNLPKWWAKMKLFDPTIRGDGRCLYFDLDTVIIDTLNPLAELSCQFGVCANFTRRHGHLDWPCSYGSCIMTFSHGFGADIADAFNANRDTIISHCGRYGDQMAIEVLHPGATLLQDVLPAGYFVGRREFTSKRPAGASLLIFAGPEKPHNTRHDWIRREWC